MLRLLLILLLLIAAAGVPFLLWGDSIDQRLTRDGAATWLNAQSGYAWATAIGLLIADLVAPVPTTAIMAALGIIYGPLLGGAIAATGSVVSGLLGYGLCRRFGRRAARPLLGDAPLTEAERLFARAGGWMVALSRWLPILSEVIACLAGLGRMPFRPFLAALLCGSLPLGFVFATLGHAGEDRPLLTLGLAAAAPVLLWLLVRPLLPARLLGPERGDG